MAKHNNTHGSPELDEDASKLVSLRQDAGPTVQDLALQEVSGKSQAMQAVADHNAALALYDEAAGEGFEDVKATDLALPQFKLLQSMSPQTKRSDAAYIPGAEEGIWHDVISNRLFREFTIVPCKFATYYIEWDGAVRGRLIANHGTDRSVMDRTHRDDKFGADMTAEGTIIIPTATWFGIVVSGIEKLPEGDTHITSQARAVVSMAGTAQKVSRRWISDAQSIQLKRADGSFFNPPLFAMSYTLSAQATKNDRGSWFLPVVNRAGLTLELPNGRNIFDAARAFSKFAAEAGVQTLVMNSDDAPGAETRQRSEPQQHVKSDTYDREPLESEIPF